MSFFIYVGPFSYVSVSLHIYRSLFMHIPANQDEADGVLPSQVRALRYQVCNGIQKVATGIPLPSPDLHQRHGLQRLLTCVCVCVREMVFPGL